MADINEYIVKAGDTLSEIALKYGTTVSALVAANGITDPDFIVVGQKLSLSGTASTSTNTTSKATIKVFGLQSNTDRTVYATWTWDKSNTENYEVKWYYDTGDSVWFVGNSSTVDEKQCTYNAPSNAKRVKFKVKPISKTYRVNDTETSYWTASWSTEKTYSFSDNPPTAPSTPTVKIEKYTLTAELDNLDVNGTEIQFQVVKNDSSVFKTEKVKIKTTSATYSCKIDVGHTYKVRCRAVRGSLYSEWSQYSSDLTTMPSVPSGITSIKASSETSIYLEWSSVKTAKTYDLEYTTEKKYFDGSDQTTTISNIEFTHYEKTGLESGKEYFFRVRAVNDSGTSAWSGIKSVVIGKKPAAPTVWASTDSATVGEEVTLYWMHNSEDNSSETYAQIEFTRVGTNDTWTVEVKNTASEEDKDKTKSYVLPTSLYVEGTEITWRVRTAGILTKPNVMWGDWSTSRTIKIYAPPTLELTMMDYLGSYVDFIGGFPFYVYALAGPSTQRPIGYQVKIVANKSYEALNRVGNTVVIKSGDAVYSKYFDNKPNYGVAIAPLNITFGPNDVDLENNVDYTLTCIVTMDSGLTAESHIDFTVSLTDDLQYEPNAEIGINEETWSAYIRPYCENEHGNHISYIKTSVYRREFDGSFTEIASDIDNNGNTYVTDPHPSLDLARYRIVAISTLNGSISYCDIPGYPVNCKSVVIQWDEEWSNFDPSSEDEMEERPWSGSMVMLPYNRSISTSGSKDVSMLEYIGRAHPVSYYGTQTGETSSITVDIPKSDRETVYALRRLEKWKGDVYVRDPSGIGYWANVSVSMSEKFKDVIIPVTINITRVEGGI